MACDKNTETVSENGILGLLAGGAVLVMSIWLLAFQIGDHLARVHVRHMSKGIAGQTAEVLRAGAEDLTTPLKAATRRELQRLMHYRSVTRMDIADASGKVIWSSDKSMGAGRLAWPASGGLELQAYRRTMEGMTRNLARSVAPLGDKGLVSLEMDMSGLLAWYKRISFMMAKGLTTVVVAVFLLMGVILFGKYRERAQAQRNLAALRKRNAEERAKVRRLQADLEELNAGMARLTRELAKAMEKPRGGKRRRGGASGKRQAG